MNIACRMTVAPSTPSTAAVNGRLANRRGSTAGRSAPSSYRTKIDEQRDDGDGRDEADHPASPPPPLPMPRMATRSAMSIAASRTRPGTSMPGGPDARPDRRGGPCPGGTTTPTTIAAKMRDRHGQQEQRLPAERPDQQPADERADRRARRDEHVEQPERGAAPVGRRQRPDQGDRRRRHERAADRLEDARRGEHLERRRDARRSATRSRTPSRR